MDSTGDCELSLIREYVKYELIHGNIRATSIARTCATGNTYKIKTQTFGCTVAKRIKFNYSNNYNKWLKDIKK